jgi:zinc and cadmium transporter
VSLLAVSIILSVVGSFGGLALASLLLLLHDHVRRSLIPSLISYAVGTLLGVAALALLPEALSQLDSTTVLSTLLVGILGFFMLEKLVIWRHCHTENCAEHDSSSALILVGGAFHNFADGCIIGAAVMSSIPLGVSTALAVAAHQIPQEVGDFAILLGSGYSRRRALMLNALAATTGVAGAILTYSAAGWLPNLVPYILAFAAGNFLYVAMSDLIPGLHRGSIDIGAIRQVTLIAAGMGTVMAFRL